MGQRRLPPGPDLEEDPKLGQGWGGAGMREPYQREKGVVGG